MAQKISFLAGEAISRGQLVDVQADDSVRVYPANAPTNPPAGIAFEDAASGSYVTVYAPGSAQVYAIASGTVAAGDFLVPPGQAPTVGGSVASYSTFSPSDISAVTGTFGVGYAETDATDGNPVYISFVPHLI